MYQQYGMYQGPFGQQPYYNPYNNMQNQQQSGYPQPQQQAQMAMQPQQQPTTPYQIQSNIEYVNGIEGAKALILPPNSQKIVLDSDSAFFYIKTTDQQGKPTVRRFKYIDIDAQEISQPKETPKENYVTLSQFEELLENFDELKKELEKYKNAKAKKSDESEVKK